MVIFDFWNFFFFLSPIAELVLHGKYALGIVGPWE